jgi:hypothetical protein
MNLVYSGLMQLLAVLGFGFVTYQGFDALISSLTSIAKNNWQGVGGDLLSLLDMMGFTDAIGYILSAVSTKAALVTTKKFLPTK